MKRKGAGLGSLFIKAALEPRFQDLAAHQNPLGHLTNQCASAPVQAQTPLGWSPGI